MRSVGLGRIPPARGYAMVNGAGGIGAGPEMTADSLEELQAWATSAGVSGAGAPPEQVTQSALQYLQQYGNAIVDFYTALFNIGPGYTAANGGEVFRQMSSTNPSTANTPTGNAYCTWLKTYHPAVWQSGDIWDPGPANYSAWRGRYLALVAAGMPDGTMVDANMVPSGIGSAINAVVQQQQVQGSGNAPTAAQLSALQIMAMQLAGMQGPQVAQQIAQQVATLPASWQQYVRGLATIWQQAGNNVPAPAGTPSGSGGSLILAAVAAKLFGLF